MPRTKEAFESMRETTRKKIEAAALSLFARNGLSVKVGEIVKKSGVSQGLMYSHYPSKYALIEELVRQAATISGKTILEISERKEPAEQKIKSITNMMCRMFNDEPAGIENFMFMAQTGMCGYFTQNPMPYTDEMPNPLQSLAIIISHGQTEGTVVSGDAFGLALVYWAAIQGLCSYAIARMPVSPEPTPLNRILLKESYL